MTKELENLKELYLDEIKKINKKGELTPVDAEAAKKALEAIEKIDELCEMDETGYSERRSYGRSMRMPEMRHGMYSERRYSRGQHEPTVDRMVRTLERVRQTGQDEETKMVIDSIIDKLEAY